MTLEPAPDDPLFRSAPAMALAPNYADWTFRLFAPLVRGEVLEVGCGVGTFTRRILQAQALERLLSIDIVPEAVARCRASLEHPSLTVTQANVVDVAGAFDLVVCMNVLEHIEDDRGALRHMLGLLRSGGSLFLLVPAHRILYSDFDRESGHFRRYSKASIRRLLAACPEAGAATIQQFYFNSIGALGYFGVYRLLGKHPRADASAEIGGFDRYVVPLLRRVEGRRVPFGISLITIVSLPERS